MRVVPQAMTDAWYAQAKIGGQRPTVRAVIQRHHLLRHQYDTAWATGGAFDEPKFTKGLFTTMIFGGVAYPREIPNIQQYSWTRSTEQDVATAELTFVNSELTPLGTLNPNDEVDQPGFYTYNRGVATVSENRWGYTDETGWRHVFMPDRLVRTFEGYGSDPSQPPWHDPNLMISGTWLVSSVTYNSSGTITLAMKDLGDLLLKQIVFPPVVPRAHYPLSWITIHSENVPSREAVGGHWEWDLRRYGSADSSNSYYIGEGLTNPPFSSYVTASGGWNGHHPNHALTSADGEYWVSTGQTTKDSFVWWEYELDNPVAVAALRVRMLYGPYRVYVSVHNGTKWVGTRKIPYKITTEDIDIEADIPYVQAVIADRREAFDIVLKRVYANAKRIRLTFTHLYDTIVGEYCYRAGLREMRIYTADNADDLSFETGEKLKVIGNYADYTDIVKWVCAWGGFWWPDHSTGLDVIRTRPEDEPTSYTTISYPHADPRLPDGRVWGTFMRAGTAGVADLTVDQFDKKPLMDVINYVRDLLGFVFFIDESGGVVWRMPNLWSLGNYLTPDQFSPRGRSRTTDIITLDEEETLLSYSTVLDSSNIRERIFVANAVGGIGVVIKGFAPSNADLRRTAGWTDQNFKTKRETRVMADMISARQMFTWRRGKAQIPGYPAIQIDDQIRIFERVTNETFYHYVMGITSTLDMAEGTWTYDLDTHWLGEEPEDAWVVDTDVMPGATQAYLAAIGYEEGPDD